MRRSFAGSNKNNERMERSTITARTEMVEISKLRPNAGQIEGLPANPRFIRNDRFDKLVASIQENPEMLSLREIIAVEQLGRYIIVCGNMRYQALKKLEIKEAPTKILPIETPTEFLRALTIIDNNNYGDWDWEQLANEWETDLLTSAGINLPEIETPDIEAQLEEEDKYTTLRFKFTEEQADRAKKAISLMRKKKKQEVRSSLGNSNKNGNALYLICTEWDELNK